MSGRATTLFRLVGLASVAAAAVAAGPAGFHAEGYASRATSDSHDTLRLKATLVAARTGRSTLARGAVIPGYLSARGLPPVRGQFTVTDTGLVFRSGDGSVAMPSAVSLAYVDDARGRPIYVFRVDAGVFETEDPGPLLEVAAHPDWLHSLGATRWATDRPLVDATDSSALWRTARSIAASPYADSLYVLFGRPRAAIGLVGRRGRIAGRLGEYVAARDSLALDPGHMMGEAQLRHAMAHELGHRWQTRGGRQVAMLWAGVLPIKDPKRYGYGSVSEHQAEAIAFAINFLQATATSTETSASSLTLLDHYELLVPGTRTMVRYLSLQPLYRYHPLRSLLTTERAL